MSVRGSVTLAVPEAQAILDAPCALGAGHQAAPLTPSLKVARFYHAQPAALDALLDVLHVLLVDDSESQSSPAPSSAGTTCFPRPPE